MQTILVVDDDDNVRRAVRYILKNHGFRVLEAQSGDLALELLNKEAIDLVILDLVMPRMDGTEVCDQIRANPTRALLPVVLFTVVRREVCRDWTNYGKANACLTKPFQVKELVTTVTELLADYIRPAAPSRAAVAAN